MHISSTVPNPFTLVPKEFSKRKLAVPCVPAVTSNTNFSIDKQSFGVSYMKFPFANDKIFSLIDNLLTSIL